METAEIGRVVKVAIGIQIEREWDRGRSLKLGILGDAIACFRRSYKQPRQNAEILSREAEIWLREEDWHSEFSFNNVCKALQIDPQATRTRILVGAETSVLAA